MEQMLVVWCICNRVDAYGCTFEEVITQPRQFTGYRVTNPVDEHILELVKIVLLEWSNGMEALVHEPYALTSNYMFFYGDGNHNWFREEF